MKKIMYLHGFASSGASGTVELLRRELWEKADANLIYIVHDVVKLKW